MDCKIEDSYPLSGLPKGNIQKKELLDKTPSVPIAMIAMIVFNYFVRISSGQMGRSKKKWCNPFDEE